MKKFLILYAVCSIYFLSNTVSAQVNPKNTWNLSVGADVIYPENNFRKTHSWGYGSTLKAEYLFHKHTSLTLSMGIYTLSGRTNEILNPDGKSATGFPVKAGLRYYLGKFYISGEGGWIKQFNYRPNDGLVYAISIGDELITKKNGNSLDLSIRHEVWITDKSRGFAAIRLAYEFRLK